MKKSLVGNIYGEIEVIEYIGERRYKCRCIKCGDITERFSANLHGEIICAKCGKGYRKDLKDSVFGFLTVKEYNKVSKKWICQCRCGKLIEVKSNNLKSGNTSSCGKCKYIERAQSDIVNGTRVSQINSKLGKNNTSGIKGVSYSARKKKWFAEIRFCGKNYWLGYYTDKSEAAVARKTAEEMLHGDFLRWYSSILQNESEEFLMKKYNVIEDNGGGLTLVVFSEDGTVEYLHGNYEYNVGQLTEDLKSLANGDNPAEEWDGNSETPQADYDDMTSYECGWEVVADNDGIYPDRMGRAACEEFKIEF